MERKRFSVGQIARAVYQQEAGVSVPDVCRKPGIPEGTFYCWKKDYGGLEPNRIRELKQLRDENELLKKLVADLSLDKAMSRVRYGYTHCFSNTPSKLIAKFT